MSASNFDFLPSERGRIAEAARLAERHGITEPVTCGMYSRMALELAVYWVFNHDAALELPAQPTLNGMLDEQDFRDMVPRQVLQAMHYVRREGNAAAHGTRLDRNTSLATLKHLHACLWWLEESYGDTPITWRAFDSELLPKVWAAAKTKAELDKLRLQLESEMAHAREEAQRRAELEEENEMLRRQMEAMQQRRESRAPEALPPAPYTEEETRLLFIDALLHEAGWNPAAPRCREFEVDGMPLESNKTGRGRVDYVLWSKNGLPLALLEAKRTSRSLAEGRVQARLYADCLERIYGIRPLIYLSNGFETSLEEPFYNHPRPVSGLATEDELEWMHQRQKQRLDLRRQRPQQAIVNRPYQLEAIARVAEAFVGQEQERLYGIRRAALLVMATGTGKTRVSAALVDVLSKAHWVRRVLFLADRNALISQAKGNFNDYLPHLSAIDLTEEAFQQDTRIVFSTYQTMMRRLERVGEDGTSFGPSFFDLIIVDEAHRSVYARYKAIFHYFDALRIGLTATPKREHDKDTYDLFDCEPGNPTASYELETAVAQGFLVPPVGKPFELGFMKRGIHYAELSPEEQREYELRFRDDETGQVPAHIPASALNNWLFNEDTLDRGIEYFMNLGLKVEGGDKIGKTIVFARNHNHAMKLKERFERNYPRLPAGFIEVIDNYDRFAPTVLGNFKVADKLPQIAVSVDMLDTGIDVPEVLNLVFFKPVFSASKYWQMVGRGTRLCSNLLGPGRDKDCFYIFDYCGNFEFFGHNPKGLATEVPKSLTHRVFEARLALVDAMRLAGQEGALLDSLLDTCHAQVAALWEERESFRLRHVLRLVDSFRQRGRWAKLSAMDIATLSDEIGPCLQDPEDEGAKRFDLAILQLQLAQATASGAHEGPLRRIEGSLAQLSRLGSIPEVRAKLGRVQEVLDIAEQRTKEGVEGDVQYWEGVRQELRSLMGLVQQDGETKEVLTAFEERHHMAGEDHKPFGDPEEYAPYRKRVERFIQAHRHHMTVARLHTNQPITAGDLEELERILFPEVGSSSPEDLQRHFGEAMGLGQIVRQVLGLDAKAAREAFSGFIHAHNLSANQMHFLDQIVTHLTRNGVIDKAMLLEAPFTDKHDQGIFGLFDDEEVQELIGKIEEINRNAVA